MVDDQAQYRADELIERQPEAEQVVDRERPGGEAGPQFFDGFKIRVGISIRVGKQKSGEESWDAGDENQRCWERGTLEPVNERCAIHLRLKYNQVSVPSTDGQARL